MKRHSGGMAIAIMLSIINSFTGIATGAGNPATDKNCPSGYEASGTGSIHQKDGRQCLSAPEDNIRVKSGDTFSVSLPANPSTGASWSLTALPATLMLTDMTYHQTEECTGRAGCGGMRTYVFRAMNKGDGVIGLQYGRIWEKEPWEKRMLKITIK